MFILQVGPFLLVLGEEAHANGLSVSLLERLHKHYVSMGDAAKGYHMMLQSNFRCNASILHLAERLFYGSGLICMVRDAGHPHSPFPLKFVCSSVNDTVADVRSTTNEQEAMIVLQEAKKVCSSWPRDAWEERNFSKSCIISPTQS